VALIALIAAADSLRGGGGPAAAPAPTTPSTRLARAPANLGPTPPAPCDAGHLHLGIATSWPQPAVVVENVGRARCHVSILRLSVAVTDRQGGEVGGGPRSVEFGGRLSGDLPAGADLVARPGLFARVRWCSGPGRPYVAWARSGPLAAHERIPCGVPGPNP